MLRRALVVLIIGAIALAGAACSTVDGQQAEALLRQASEAQANVQSMTFGVRISGDVDGHSFTMNMDGGAYLKGQHAGDFVLDASAQAPSIPTTTFTALRRNGETFVQIDGRWQRLPQTAANDAGSAPLEQQLGDFDFSRYVTDVSVTSGTTFLNEPVTKIVGVIDTTALFNGLVDQLGGNLSQFGGGALPPDFASHLGDTKAVLYVSDETHLLRAALITMSFEDQGKKLELHLDYALRGVDVPVDIPNPAAAV
jgi:hypothetical protein